MIYAIGIIGVIGFIFLLLWRLEKAKHEKTKLGKELAEQRALALREIRRLEAELQTAADVERPRIKARIIEIEEKIRKAESGELVEDVFGTGGQG